MSRSLDLNKIKNRFNNKIVSSEDALKDVEPFYSEEEITKILNNKEKIR